MGKGGGSDITDISLNTKAGADNTEHKLNSETQDSKTGKQLNRELVVKLRAVEQLSAAQQSCESQRGGTLVNRSPAQGRRFNTPHTAKSELAVIVYKQFI